MECGAGGLLLAVLMDLVPVVSSPSKPLRIVFLGADAIALPLLEWLAGEGASAGEVVGVFTQPDRPSGRGQRVQPNAIKAWALARGLPVWQPEKADESARATLAAAGADVALVMAYGHILRDAFIATPRLGTLNLHTSILPAYRGASPIQAAVTSGDRETGVTLMRIVRQLDAGPVADVERVPISAGDTAAEVEERLAAACVPLLARTLPALRDGRLEFRAQDEAAASHCRKLSREDGALDFGRPATELAARINGLFPWPGCVVEGDGLVLKLGLAEATGDAVAGAAPGTVLSADPDGIRVATGNGILRLLRLQRPGGRMLPAAEFLRGCPMAPGRLFASRPMTALVTRR